MLELFPEEYNNSKNYLPYDGCAHYYGRILTQEEADFYFQTLLNTLKFQPDEVVIFGKKIITKREVAWYGYDELEYTYSHTTKKSHRWTRELLELKQKVEAVTQHQFNACLVNLYHDGSEGMSWHSDNEKDLENNSAIASLSLGAERRFMFKHKTTKEKVELRLQHGSLLIMKNETQHFWLHQVPISKKITTPRINLTFRSIKVI